jgi:putative hydrolase of HD superfamily
MDKPSIQNFIEISGKFKDLKRSGWLKRQVSGPESDAEHSFSLALLVLLLKPQHLKTEKCLKLALIHDLAEVYSGDYTPVDDITPQQKHAAETGAIQRLSQELQYPELEELFAEYEAKQTAEAIFVNALDKLDTVLTAEYYDRTKRSPNNLIPEFCTHAIRCLDHLENVDTRIIKQILQDIKERDIK